MRDVSQTRSRSPGSTAAYAGLRLGECAALTRGRVDLAHGTIAIVEQAQRVVGRGRILGDPKSDAGKRTVAIPAALVAILEVHLASFVGPGDDALVFTADKGGPLLGQHLDRRFARVREAVGIGWVRLHDLRHVAGTTAAQTGATTRELMARLGHSTPRAALVYQHATAGRDHAIAEGLDRIIQRGRATRRGSVPSSPREPPPDCQVPVPAQGRVRPLRAMDAR